jgi:hypothetical protein
MSIQTGSGITGIRKIFWWSFGRIIQAQASGKSTPRNCGDNPSFWKCDERVKSLITYCWQLRGEEPLTLPSSGFKASGWNECAIFFVASDANSENSCPEL